MRRLTAVLTQLADAHESELGTRVARGDASVATLRRLAEQMYLQEKWPSHIAYVYLSLDGNGLDDRDLIKYVLSIIRTENLGVGSKNLSHRQLVEKFAQALGINKQRLERARPIPANQALMDWCDMSSQDRPWQQALAVHVACEAQFRLARRIRIGLLQHYGLNQADVALWTVHAGPVERKHARDGFRLLENHCGKSSREGIIHSFSFTCKLVREFYDEI